MLTHLSIKDFAIVDRVDIQFGSGFNVITGETGAGKSILVRALGLLLGGKGSPDMIRSGFEEAVMSAQFIIEDSLEVVKIAEDLGLKPIQTEENGFVSFILRRHLSAKGKSLAFINDTPVTLSALKDVGSGLLDVFGQHDNNRLLNTSHHVSFIDLFLNSPKIKERYQEALHELNGLITKLQLSLNEQAEVIRNQDFIRFRYDEVLEFAPTKADYEKISELCKAAESSTLIRETFQSLKAIVDQSVDDESVSKPVWEMYRQSQRVVQKIDGQHREFLQQTADECKDIAERLDKLSFDINGQLDGLDIDESELEKAETRLAGYQGFFRKFSVSTIDEFILEVEKLAHNIELIENASFVFSEHIKALEEQVEVCKKAGLALSKARKIAAEFLKSNVSKHLQTMAMPAAVIEASFEPATKKLPAVNLAAFGANLQKRWDALSIELQTFGVNGLEVATLLGRTNKGEALMPLQKMASGGELSRIMLALKTVSAIESEPTVLVFDEIDAGISGKVADAVGKKIRYLAKSFQVICISHLPQVAVYADTHIVVQKSEEKSRTSTSIHRLPEQERPAEIAKLLSGTEVTGSSLSNARELLRKAKATSADISV